MNAIRFVAALALICTNSLFAAESSSDAGPKSDKKVQSKYVIQPPDVIQIEMVKVIPKPPYRAAVFDVFQVRAKAIPDQPIDDYFMVEAEGEINLGQTYGSVHVAGMTIDEVRTTINKSLQQWSKDSGVTVKLARVSETQPITGQYLVGPDGTINLRQYGVVKIGGKTAAEARIVIQDHLKQFLDSPKLTVDVVAKNSKAYYIIIQGAGLVDGIRRMPCTGNDETVLGAISQINGLSQLSSKKIWVARPAPHNFGCQQILPIDWTAITQRAEMATNYQLMPGDRLVIAEDELVTFSEMVNMTMVQKVGKTAALESTPNPNPTTVHEQTAGQIQTMGHHYNSTRNGQ